jgi:hypothetical protein
MHYGGTGTAFQESVASMRESIEKALAKSGGSCRLTDFTVIGLLSNRKIRLGFSSEQSDEWCRLNTFTINTENNIAALSDLPAGAAPSNAFTSEKELAKVTADWPISRLVETWNSFAGVAPFDDLKLVKKFTNRTAAVGRIWTAVQRLSPDTAPRATEGAPAQRGAKKSPARAKRRDTPRTGANAVPKGAKKATSARDGSKAAKVLDLLKRKDGVTLKELMRATGWQAHSVRGFLSGAVSKKMGLAVTSTKSEKGERSYSVKA